MATLSVSGSLTPDTLQSIFKAVDRNGDSQVSADEFSVFLNKLRGVLTGSAQGAGIGSAATAVAAPFIQTLAPSDGYAPVPGFDFGKLQDLTHVNDKYTPAVRVFSMAIHAGNLPPTSDSLKSIVSYAVAHGFPNAEVAGADLINFGDGHGPIDVIGDVGGPRASWWFNNNP